MYNVDLQKFKEVFPYRREPEMFVNLLDNILNANGIDTKERVNMFLAQCGHESGGFTITSENLNYSAKGLRSTFPKYFKSESEALSYERKPEKIANKVYANRMGNSDENSGDGWKYRGAGFIQLTGKVNYEAFSKDMGIDALNNPDLVRNDLTIAIKSAIWFWNKNNLNKYCDNNDFIGLTKKINGGINGLTDRETKYKKLMA